MVIGTIADIGGAGFEAFNNLRRSIEEAGDRLQKASLALGKNFQQVSTELTPAMEGLRGTLDQRTAAAIAGLEAGLQGTSVGLAKLINQQQLTNTAFGNTANVMAKLQQVMGVSITGIDQLSDNIRETGAEFTVSTDKLVNAIDALKDTFPTQALAGMGSQVTEAMMNLTAQMPAMGAEVASVMRMILDPSLKTEQNLARLGISGVRERLAAANSTKEAEKILIEAIKTSAQTIKSFVSKDFFASVSIANNLFGQQAPLLVALNEQLGKRAKNEEAVLDFGDTIEVIRSSMLVPLNEVLRDKFYPAIKQISAVLSGIGERFADALSRWIDKLDFSEKSVFGFTDMLVNASIIIAKAAQDFGNAMLEFTNLALPQIKNAFNAMANGVTAMGHMLESFRDPKKLTRMLTRLTSPIGMIADKTMFGDLDLFGDADWKKAKTDYKQTEFERLSFADDSSTLIITLKELLSTSEDIAGNTGRTAAATEAVNDKTLDPFGTTSDDYLSTTAASIQANMANIMGMTPADQAEETNALLAAMLGEMKNRGLSLAGSF